MTKMSVRDASLYVDVVGQGYPLLLMHGGPGADHWTLLPFRRCEDRFTLIFYDHRCNGRSTGAPLSSMNWENLTADADALRQELGFERWAVLGHSFGGQVALEYALRYPDRLSHLVLLDTVGDTRWWQQNAADLLAKRGDSPKKVKAARRFFNGRIAPWEFFPTLMRLGSSYNPHTGFFSAAREMFIERRARPRAKPLIYGARELWKGWTVMDRLGEIEVPTLVMAGRDDFLSPPEHQAQLAAGIPNARLEIIERAGHNPHSERPDDVMVALKDFLPAEVVPAAEASLVRT
jgi:proline iminopeptidase